MVTRPRFERATPSFGGWCSAIAGRRSARPPSNLVDLWLGDWREFAILEGGGFEVRSSEHMEFNSDTLVWLETQRLDAYSLNSDEAWTRIFAVSGTNNVGTGDVFI